MKRLGSILLTLLLPSAALAANTSGYTTFNLKKCNVLQAAAPEEEFSGSYLCHGHEGYKIYFAEGDLRSFLAFGKSPKDHCATHQTFSGFNSVDSTVEWRLNRGKPIATIQRWRVSYDPDNAEKIKSWLVVTMLEPHNSCWMARIEGALPNANAKARELADQMSPTFNCTHGHEKILTLSSSDLSQADSASTCQQ